MEAIKEHREWVVLAVITAVMVVLAVISGNNTQTATDNKNEVQAATQDDKDNKAVAQAQTDNDGGNYNYVAQDGDSYSVLARKAVQTYGITEKVNLSQAEIIAAETNLTNQAGSPLLNAGQTVTITRANVRAAVDTARKMSDAEEAAWRAYVPSVEFRTDNNGE